MPGHTVDPWHLIVRCCPVEPQLPRWKQNPGLPSGLPVCPETECSIDLKRICPLDAEGVANVRYFPVRSLLTWRAGFHGDDATVRDAEGVRDEEWVLSYSFDL